MTVHLILTQVPDRERLELTLTTEGFELALRLLSDRAAPDDLPVLERNEWPATATRGAALSPDQMLERLLEGEIANGEWTIVPGNLVEMHGSYLLMPGDRGALIDRLVAGERSAQSEYASLPVYYDEGYALHDPITVLLERPLILRRIKAPPTSVSERLLGLARVIDAEALYLEQEHNDGFAANRLRLAIQDVAALMVVLTSAPDAMAQINDLMAAWQNHRFNDQGEPLDG